MRRAGGVGALAVAATLLLSGCMPPFMDVCPAIGFVSGVAIDTSALADDVFLQVCADGECSPAPGEDPASATASFWIGEDDGRWSLSFPTGTSDEVTIRVFDPTGAPLSDRDYAIDWTHSTERCGGPSTAPPIVLRP